MDFVKCPKIILPPPLRPHLLPKQKKSLYYVCLKYVCFKRMNKKSKSKVNVHFAYSMKEIQVAEVDLQHQSIKERFLKQFAKKTIKELTFCHWKRDTDHRSTKQNLHFSQLLRIMKNKQRNNRKFIPVYLSKFNFD